MVGYKHRNMALKPADIGFKNDVKKTIKKQEKKRHINFLISYIPLRHVRIIRPNPWPITKESKYQPIMSAAKTASNSK
jgi:hypothetical protein